MRLNSEGEAGRHDDSSVEKIAALTEIICRAGDEPETKSAALLVLMAIIESSAHTKVLADVAKHCAYIRCADANLCGIDDAQVEMLERRLFAENGYLF